MNPIKTDDLSARITSYVTEQLEATIARFFPDLNVPRFFCGYRRAIFHEAPDLAYTLAALHNLGVKQISGIPIADAIARVLRTVDGKMTDTFFSYFVAESILEFGTFNDDNPVIAQLNERERGNLREAVDSTAVLDRQNNALPHHARNYWAVLARCEWDRMELGLITDRTVFDIAMEKVREFLFENPSGFFDDERFSNGRYDSYSADMYLFVKPMWHCFDEAKLMENVHAHVRLIELAVEENGAAITWGRSIGALSVCLSMEFMAFAIRYELASDPGRAAALIENAFAKIQGWFSDDLTSAHRGRDTERYRGIHRLLQVTINCLRKLCYAAEMLQARPATLTPPAELFPSRDELIRFDERNASVWLFRNEHFSFQFAMVDGPNADYAPWFHQPGVFESPIGSQIYCGVPRIAQAGGLEFTTIGRPSAVAKSPGGLGVTYEEFRRIGGNAEETPLKGKREAKYSVRGDVIAWEEELTLDEEPEEVSYFIPEANHRLSVKVTSENSFHQDVINTSGMAEMRSPWCELTALHQIHFAPAKLIRFTIELKILT